jgi:hypothetical protein
MFSIIIVNRYFCLSSPFCSFQFPLASVVFIFFILIPQLAGQV